ncbi:hypothetical protein MOO45_02970 [Bombilactobacillus folatiphilus]|uniref:Uncharacterized protein n=1 Tax=Bombilactobacillus folatiphilus TaxID=2923362 RepID=A0ABY4PA57_9LACO|nr:CRISPR-associated protein Csn2-St [Bombilactobacillus folatiphilus]UQS82623.1 hypothetical protein MOO45_02970 [Bombilactobacillus folatiphilus]
MNLKLEYHDGKYIDVDLDQFLYFTGPNKKLLWQVFRSFYYYQQKVREDLANIYGDNGIEIYLNQEKLVSAHNHFYFINSRNAIYQQLKYQKASLLFNFLNQQSNEPDIVQHIERLNNELYQLTFVLQDYVDSFANSLQVDLEDLNYLQLLKDHLTLGYQEDQQMTPLELMSTDELVDEYVNLLRLFAQDNSDNCWLILYNLPSYLSQSKIHELLQGLKEITQTTNLKVIYIANDLKAVNLTQEDIENIVLVHDQAEQLPNYDTLHETLAQHYPNEMKITDCRLLSILQNILPLVGYPKKVDLAPQDLILLKVMNELSGYETSFNSDDFSLTSAEISFLKRD